MKKKEFESLCQRIARDMAEYADGDYDRRYAAIVGRITATAGMTKEHSFTASQLSQIFGLVYEDTKNSPQEAVTSGSHGK